MRRFLNKVFKHTTKSSQFGAPTLPSDLSFSELTYMTKRGFLAGKLSQYLSMKREEGSSLFYQSLARTTFKKSKIENDHERLLQLSEQMLEWGKQNENIPEKIKKLDVKDDIQNAMLKAYDMFEKDLFLSGDVILDENSEVSAKHNEKPDPTWLVYREVIFAATQGQFLLISEEEVTTYKAGNVLYEGWIKERSDIPTCRNQAKEIFEQKEFNKAKVMSWLLVLSEAITNTIKHAEEGKMTLIEDGEKKEMRFVIEDKGPGFSLEELPKTTLLAGYSTKKSMGQGFSLMMKMSKQVLLYTSPVGSTVILTFDCSQEIEGKVVS
ncbi:ATP-binding protein [Alkalihalobacillus deserti]|uniref:ATP-binding protein n=1 Tax=Alkalihalobacillus deserti TaxID=2879466 RepID=UPI001D152885|nr:ATP-binding protein [Alkalihalobacillus deserti]